MSISYHSAGLYVSKTSAMSVNHHSKTSDNRNLTPSSIKMFQITLEIDSEFALFIDSCFSVSVPGI